VAIVEHRKCAAVRTHSLSCVHEERAAVAFQASAQGGDYREEGGGVGGQKDVKREDPGEEAGQEDGAGALGRETPAQREIQRITIEILQLQVLICDCRAS